MKGNSGAVIVEPVGPTLNNGFDVGGARNYPWSKGLAIMPPAYFSEYVGPASGNPIVPPAAALAGTTGQIGAGMGTSNGMATASPLGLHSPLVLVIAGLAGVLAVMYHQGYKTRKA